MFNVLSALRTILGFDKKGIRWSIYREFLNDVSFTIEGSGGASFTRGALEEGYYTVFQQDEGPDINGYNVKHLFLGIEDAEDVPVSGGYTDILMPMFNTEKNVDDSANGWGFDRDDVVIVDGPVMSGAYTKTFNYQGKACWTYTAGAPIGVWVHWKRDDQEIKVFPRSL
jgi:hypothetical protein